MTEYDSGRVSEETNEVLIVSPPWYDRLSRKPLSAIISASVIYLAATFGSSLLDPTEKTSEYSGSGEYVYLSGQTSLPIVDNIGVYAGGEAKHDITGMPDSNAHERGLYVQDIEYYPDGGFRLDAFQDDQIGFYILMSEYDGDGVLKEFNYKNVGITTEQPLACSFDLGEDGAGNATIEPADDCKRLINNDPLGWRGIENAAFAKGGLFGTRLDDTPPGLARTMTDEMLDNVRCNFGLRYGLTPAEKAQWRPYDIPVQWYNGRDVYEGVRQNIIARYRKIASDAEQLPLTDVNGRPIFLTETERDFLIRVAEKYGPIPEMDAAQYSSAVKSELQAVGNRLVPRWEENPSIRIGDPVAKDLIELQKKYPTIIIDEITSDKDWAKSGGDPFSYLLNENCIPAVPELLDEFVLESQMISEIGGLVGLLPGTTLVVDPVKAQESEFMETIYVFGGANNFFADHIYQIMPEQEIVETIARYKRNKDIDLTEQEAQLLDSLDDLATSASGGNG